MTEPMTWLCYPYTSNSWVNPSSTSHQTWICDISLGAIIVGWTHEHGMIFLNIHRQITDEGEEEEVKKKEEERREWEGVRKEEEEGEE